MKKGNGRHIGSSSQLVFLLCSLLLLLLVACKGESTPQATPWGTVIGDTVQTKEHYSLHDIISNGELILLTLSGPETYYEYRGGGLGTQYLLCEKFAQQIGVSVRVEVCRDTSEMISRLLKGEGDIMTPIDSASLKDEHLLMADRRIPWAVMKGNDELADSIRHWFRPEYLAEVKSEQTQAFSPQSVQRRVYSPMLNQQKGIISQYDHLFKRYASVARTDWRLLAAMSYQESCFDPNARSWAGACGLMQIMPKTAAQYGLPLSQIFTPEPNIETSTRIIRRLKEQFRDIPHDAERMKFVLASYNGGVGHVRDAMALARKYGKNPHRWTDVSQYILLLSQPQYYQDPVVKSGYMRGTETYDYVRLVLARYDRYRGAASGSSFGFGGSGQIPKEATKRHRFKN